MTEAWLLFQEDVLRRAAGNPRGNAALLMPALRNLETLPDPKALLHALLREACAARGRRAKAFYPRSAVHRLAELIDDFSPLRRLSAFATLEADLCRVLHDNGWLREP